MDKYYIFRYYSLWGMGSDSDEALLTEDALRQIIGLELAKKEAGARYDDRMTGTWNEEVFCDSKDREEVLANIIRKRLSTCSTYAGVNDLILLPSDRVIQIREERMENVIFRLSNQFGYRRDVIAGEAVFQHYIVDFDEELEKYHFDSRYVDFVSYSMKNAAENHYFYKVDDYLKMNRNKAERMRKKLRKLQRQEVSAGKGKGKANAGEQTPNQKTRHSDEGKKRYLEQETELSNEDMKQYLDLKTDFSNEGGGQYIDDILPEIGTPEYYRESLEEAEYDIKKFSDIPQTDDQYAEHVYHHKVNHVYWDEVMKEYDQEDEETDHTKWVYKYPLIPDDFACVISERTCDENLRYDELFKKGASFQYLMADVSSGSDELEDIGDINPFWVLRNVFGYD